MTSGEVRSRFLDVIPHEFARRHLVLLQQTAGDHPTLLHSESTEPCVLHNVCAAVGSSLTLEPADVEKLALSIDDAYASRGGEAIAEVTRVQTPSDEELVRAARDADLLALDGKGPIVRLVDSVLFDAVQRGASDIHVQPLAGETLIRLRIDGVLLTSRRVPQELASAIVSRVKVMARLDVAERRSPQDGRASVTIGHGKSLRGIDLRVSTLPSSAGERLVLRLLDTQRGTRLASVEALDMPEGVRTAFLDQASRASGIILATGPTGSGKTTTLYAALRWIAQRSATINLMTIEDPVEYDLSAPGSSGARLPISQTQVDPLKGVTFAAGLRHILRQDPDVIMVGEIRDAETARIAVQASLTGHLVFSTLHTNDAPSSLTRLVDLGVEPFLIASSLSAVLAQRLVRLSHQACSGSGCESCLNSGYRGRRGVFELLCVDGTIRSLLTSGASADDLRQAAIAGGMRTLQSEGASLAAEGLTTIEEVHRVTRGGGVDT